MSESLPSNSFSPEQKTDINENEIFYANPVQGSNLDFDGDKTIHIPEIKNSSLNRGLRRNPSSSPSHEKTAAAYETQPLHKFDPNTGLRIVDEPKTAAAYETQPLHKFDPNTGLRINNEGKAADVSRKEPKFDPITGLRINNEGKAADETQNKRWHVRQYNKDIPDAPKQPQILSQIKWNQRHIISGGESITDTGLLKEVIKGFRIDGVLEKDCVACFGKKTEFSLNPTSLRWLISLQDRLELEDGSIINSCLFDIAPYAMWPKIQEEINEFIVECGGLPIDMIPLYGIIGQHEGDDIFIPTHDITDLDKFIQLIEDTHKSGGIVGTVKAEIQNYYAASKLNMGSHVDNIRALMTIACVNAFLDRRGLCFPDQKLHQGCYLGVKNEFGPSMLFGDVTFALGRMPREDVIKLEEDIIWMMGSVFESEAETILNDLPKNRVNKQRFEDLIIIFQDYIDFIDKNFGYATLDEIRKYDYKPLIADLAKQIKEKFNEKYKKIDKKIY